MSAHATIRLLHKVLAATPGDHAMDTVRLTRATVQRLLDELTSGPRVFRPGDELPVGVWVIGPDGTPVRAEFTGTRVDPGSRHSLVEVVLPDYDAAVASAGTPGGQT